MKVQIGLKRKHLTVPDGWRVVKDGVALPSDQFANVGNPNAPFWQPVRADDVGDPADEFDALIRRS